MKNGLVLFFLFYAAFCFSQEPQISKESDPVIFTKVEEQAEYPGGISEMFKFISKNIVFPQRAREDSLFTSCKVYVKFVVDEAGLISSPQVLKGCAGYAECDEESIRVIKSMPRWKPAKIDGKPVKCYFTLPIYYKLQ